MKAAWLIVATLCSQFAYAQATADKASIELLLAKEQFSNTIDAVQQQPDYASNADWQELHIQALMGLQKNEDADELMVKALQQFPKRAELYHLAAMNKFALAEQVSIFSAPGYAKEGLAQLKQAVQLAPEQGRFQLTLLGFYLQAPGIVGGDEKLARQMAADLQQAAAAQKADPVDAAIAQSMVLQSDEKTAAALQLLDAQLQQTPANVRLLVQKANVLRSDKQDAAALPLYQQAVKLAEKPGAQHQHLYQIGRIVALTGQDANVGKAALKQVIAFYQHSEGQSLHWARLKLAQIHLAEQDISSAQQLLQPLLALDSPSDRLAAEVSALHKQLKKPNRKPASQQRSTWVQSFACWLSSVGRQALDAKRWTSSVGLPGAWRRVESDNVDSRISSVLTHKRPAFYFDSQNRSDELLSAVFCHAMTTAVLSELLGVG